MNEYLNQIEISGITYDLVASGGTGGSGVTSGQVETMIRNYTYDKFTIDRKIDNAFDPEQYYTRADIDTKESDLNERIDELSGKTLTVSGEVSTLEEDVENAFQEIKNVKLELSGAIDTKQDLLVAGDNIIITGNVISAVMSGGSGVTSGQVQMMIDQSISGISGDTNIISGDVKTLSGDVKTISGNVVTISGDVQGLETKIDALSGNLDDKQDKLIAGQGISISDSNVISTSGSVTQIEAAWGDAFGHDLYIAQYGGQNPGPKIIAKSGEGIIINRTDGEPTGYNGVIRCNFNTVQRKLSAGTGIDITNNVISVTGGGQSSGVTSGEVQTMINKSISGKVDDVTTSFASWEEGSGFTINVIKNGQTIGRDLFAPNFGLKYRKSISHNTPYLEVDMDYINSHISGGTSGITYSAGTGIDITDRVISSTLNAYNGTGVESLIIGSSANTVSGDLSVGVGKYNEVLGGRSFAQGLSGKTTNTAEATFGQLNDTKHEYVGFGHSGNTVFTIGNGAGVDGSTTNYARHNAFEVRSNGDIYIPEPSKVDASHYYQAPMIKLQDRLSEIDNKPNIWCGSESQWSQISGSTQSGTLYLIY